MGSLSAFPVSTSAAQRDLPLFQPKRKLHKRARRMRAQAEKKSRTNRYTQCPDGAQRQRADRIIPVARNAHESCTGQLRERRHSACKHAAHRAERRRQPRKVSAGSEGKQAHPHRRAELHQTAAQKSQLGSTAATAYTPPRHPAAISRRQKSFCPHSRALHARSPVSIAALSAKSASAQSRMRRSPSRSFWTKYSLRRAKKRSAIPKGIATARSSCLACFCAQPLDEVCSRTIWRMFFSAFARGSITSCPQPRQRRRKSMPVRSTSQRLSPQGCSFFITRMSPSRTSSCVPPIS